MRLVSVDVGNGWVKAQSSTVTDAFESVQAVEQGALQFDGLGVNHARIIDFDGERYALGLAAYSHARHATIEMGRARVGRKSYKVLFAASLAAVIRQSTPLAVVLSLPVKWYTGGRDKARRDMAGVYTVGYGGRTCVYDIDFDDCHIVPEGFGSICAEVLGPDGSIRDGSLARSTVGVVDIGTRTVDYLYFDCLEIHPARCDGQDKTGMATVWAMLQEDVASEIGLDLPEHDIDHALQVGYVMDADQQRDTRHLSERALQTLGDTINGKISSLWQDGRDVQALLITGGGAYHVFPHLDFAHKRLIEPGYMANCAGAYRFGLQRGFAYE